MSTLILLALALPGVLLILGLLLNASPGLPRLGDDRGSIDNFIPKIWSARILSALRHAIVYGQDRVANRNYEGEIAQAGDTVHINSVGDPTIF